MLRDKQSPAKRGSPEDGERFVSDVTLRMNLLSRYNEMLLIDLCDLTMNQFNMKSL